jgi:hypothetical protein
MHDLKLSVHWLVSKRNNYFRRDEMSHPSSLKKVVANETTK